MSELHHEQEAPIRAYLTYYIDREMVSAWQNFPTTQEELEANRGMSGIGREHIADVLDTIYETEILGLDRRLPRKPDLDELNYLAARIEGMSELEHLTFSAAVETKPYNDSLAELIDLTHNPNQFELFPGSFSETEFGGIMAEMHFNDYAEVIERLRASDDPLENHFADYVERLESSIDLQKYGIKAREAEGGYLTSHGYLLPMVDVPSQMYSGKQDIPAEHLVIGRQDAPERKPSLLGQLAAVKAERNTADTARTDAPEKKAPSGPEL